ncbi:hypothetical protein P7K49_002891, partial [Saguinus oedipus]
SLLASWRRAALLAAQLAQPRCAGQFNLGAFSTEGQPQSAVSAQDGQSLPIRQVLRGQAEQLGPRSRTRGHSWTQAESLLGLSVQV